MNSPPRADGRRLPDGALALLHEKSAQALKLLRLNGAVCVRFSGWEKTIAARLPNWLRLAGKFALERVVVLDGAAPEEGTFQEMEKAGVERFVLRVERWAETERRAVRRLNAVRSADLEVELLFTRKNYAVLQKAARDLEKEGVRLKPSPLSRGEGSPDAAGHDLALMHALDWACLEPLIRPHSPTGAYFSLIEAAYGRGEARPARCPLAWSELSIDLEGRLFPCRHRTDLPCGTLHADGLPAVTKNLNAAFGRIESAPCFGRHCVARFDKTPTV